MFDIFFYSTFLYYWKFCLFACCFLFYYRQSKQNLIIWWRCNIEVLFFSVFYFQSCYLILYMCAILTYLTFFRFEKFQSVVSKNNNKAKKGFQMNLELRDNFSSSFFFLFFPATTLHCILLLCWRQKPST